MDRSIGLLLAALRRRVRSAGARFFAAALGLALATAILLPSQGAAGAAVVLESALVVIGIGAALVAAASAGALPEDRGSGVHAWLAATACPKALLRATPAVAGLLVTVVVTLGASVLAALAIAASGLDIPTHHTTPLSILGEEGQFLTGSMIPPEELARGRYLETRIEGPVGEIGSTIPVEVDLRPRFQTPEAANIGSVHLAVNVRMNSEAPDAEVERAPLVAVRGRSVLALPAGRRSTLSSFDPRVDLRVVSARRIDGPASFLANVLRAGLLLGLALASIAPLAVLLSRFLSASSAVASALVLAAVGVLHGPLLGLAADAQGVAGASIASAILKGATWLAPDLSVVSGASEALVGHILTAGEFARLGPPALHAAVTLLLLAFLPARKIDA